jgi:Kdo2-lipid IVA lauroyltransferase/acyltransferase
LEQTKSILWDSLSLLPLGFIKAFARFGAFVHRCFDSRHREECKRIIELTDIKTPSKVIVKKMYYHIWRILYEIMWVSKTNNEEFIKNFEGHREFLDYIDKEHKDQAILFITAHLGAWELVPNFIARMITPIICNYKPAKEKWLNNFIIRARSQRGLTPIAKEGSIVRIFKELKRGKTAGMVIDQHGGENGVDSVFLGAPCKSWDIMATLANKTQCPLIPLAIIRNKGKYKLLWEKEIGLVYSSEGKLDIENTTLKIDRTISNFIHEAPEQWMWLGRRWGRHFESLMKSNV